MADGTIYDGAVEHVATQHGRKVLLLCVAMDGPGVGKPMPILQGRAEEMFDLVGAEDAERHELEGLGYCFAPSGNR